ncbi:MAG: hypothetical protein JWO95_2059 [Verrucomicrobiales bacterium]|nr:hypothetical protein [Verrucomicrobiales bacterium]
MRRRWKILLLAACGLIAVVAVCFFSLREKEPSYNGRTLSEWLERYNNSSEQTDGHSVQAAETAAQAVRAIGTNGVAVLLQWTVAKTPIIDGLGNGFRKLPDRLRKSFVKIDHALINASAQTKHQYVEQGFEVLGTNAAPMLPDLMRVFNNVTNVDDMRMMAEIIERTGLLVSMLWLSA